MEYPEKIYDIQYHDIMEYIKKVAKASSQPVEVKKSAFGTSKKADANAKEKTKIEIECEQFEKVYNKEMEESKHQNEPDKD